MKKGIILFVILAVVFFVVGVLVGYMQTAEVDKQIDTENINKVAENLLTEEDAKKIIEEKYEAAIDMFLFSKEFNIITDIEDIGVIKENVEGENYTNYYYPITNYDEVVEKYLSKNIIEYYEENAYGIIEKEGKKYTTDGGSGFISYDGIEEIKDVNIEEEKITCTVKIKCNDLNENFLEYRESKFELVKKDDSWLIEKFDFEKIK